MKESVTTNEEQRKEYVSKQKENGRKELPRSLGITIPNIDLNEVHDTNPLEKTQKDLLIQYGYKLEQIAQMDAGDFQEAERQQRIPEESWMSIKNIYPELKEADLFKWTWGDFEAYSIKKDRENAYTVEDQERLAKRNITIEDAIYLRKEYHSLDNILRQDDSDLKKYLETYYRNKISYAEAMEKRDYDWIPKGSN